MSNWGGSEMDCGFQGRVGGHNTTMGGGATMQGGGPQHNMNMGMPTHHHHHDVVHHHEHHHASTFTELCAAPPANFAAENASYAMAPPYQAAPQPHHAYQQDRNYYMPAVHQMQQHHGVGQPPMQMVPQYPHASSNKYAGPPQETYSFPSAASMCHDPSASYVHPLPQQQHQSLQHPHLEQHHQFVEHFQPVPMQVPNPHESYQPSVMLLPQLFQPLAPEPTISNVAAGRGKPGKSRMGEMPDRALTAEKRLERRRQQNRDSQKRFREKRKFEKGQKQKLGLEVAPRSGVAKR